MMEEQTFPADLDSLQKIRDYVKNAAQTAGLDKRATYDLQLAVDEIATNIITYGYAGVPSAEIKLQVELFDDKLKVILEDAGVEFDPTTKEVDESDLSRPLDERAIGGLGIFLAIQGVDKFSYKRMNDKNYNIFEMNRKKD